ncbi:MAG: hypothetical protein PF450_08320 [Bacteroidales bacterium]|jgi:hypothetical protein|nr:hypothetical protein [Bacteroidales bacterium]
MAIVGLNPAYESISGRIDNLVFYSYNNRTFCRSHVIGRNPQTLSQQKNRNLFALAVQTWQRLTVFEKKQWNMRSKGHSASGYNYFLSRFMKYNKINHKIKATKTKTIKRFYHRDTEAQRKTREVYPYFKLYKASAFHERFFMVPSHFVPLRAFPCSKTLKTSQQHPVRPRRRLLRCFAPRKDTKALYLKDSEAQRKTRKVYRFSKLYKASASHKRFFMVPSHFVSLRAFPGSESLKNFALTPTHPGATTTQSKTLCVSASLR